MFSGKTSEDNVSVDVDDGEPDDEEPAVKKTGFSLYNSYLNTVDVDENAIKYVIVYVKQLGEFFSLFPCPGCLSTSSLTMVTIYLHKDMLTICNFLVRGVVIGLLLIPQRGWGFQMRAKYVRST